MLCQKTGAGEVRCHDLRYGGVLWSRSFDEGVNAAPAIGPGPKNQSMVVVAVGNNPKLGDIMTPVVAVRLPSCPCLPEPIIATPKHAQILALDGQDGSTLWSFTAPEYSLSCAGNTPTEICCPSMWSQPTIASDADGRVYVNWSGGKLFSLMDVDLDGKIDLNDPREFSFYHHGKGSNSQTALAPGLMVAAVCNQVFAGQAHVAHADVNCSRSNCAHADFLCGEFREPCKALGPPSFGIQLWQTAVSFFAPNRSYRRIEQSHFDQAACEAGNAWIEVIYEGSWQEHGGSPHVLSTSLASRRVTSTIVRPESRNWTSGNATNISVFCSPQECPLIHEVYLTKTQYFSYNASEAQACFLSANSDQGLGWQSPQDAL
eukprot:g33555.t1